MACQTRPKRVWLSQVGTLAWAQQATGGADSVERPPTMWTSWHRDSTPLQWLVRWMSEACSDKVVLVR
eukprot:5587016-Karenia_brevis.AAC.1